MNENAIKQPFAIEVSDQSDFSFICLSLWPAQPGGGAIDPCSGITLLAVLLTYGVIAHSPRAPRSQMFQNQSARIDVGHEIEKPDAKSRKYIDRHSPDARP